jgi:CMP-N,N'-diacetyllegionaminic acid synthase
MNVVAVVTAKGVSTGLPRKNLRLLAGKPLLAHSIAAAKEAHSVGRVIVSTESDEVRKVALEWGAEVPFMRPKELARDDSSHTDVMIHAITWMEKVWGIPDAVLLLQPTSPLRTPQDIDGAVDLMRKSGCPAVVGVTEAKIHPYLTYKMGIDGDLMPYVSHNLRYPRRQDFPPAVALNGSIYLNRCESLLLTRTFQPEGTRAWLMPPERSVDIDRLEDFEIAEMMIRRRSLNHGKHVE